jgi:hypothetical protein
VTDYLIDGQVIPYVGGRKCVNTLSYRDATDLEMRQAEEIKALEEEVSRLQEKVSELQWERDCANGLIRWGA